MINNSVESTSFYIDPKERLVRVSTPRRGKPYEHRCSRQVYEQVAHWIDERHERPFTGEEIVAGENAPHSQVFAALGFLYERSIIDREKRLNFAVNPGGVHLDAMDGMARSARRRRRARPRNPTSTLASAWPGRF